LTLRPQCKKKLDADFRPYVILGACNPEIAFEAFQRELEIGSLLPCNAIVYQNDNGGTNISFMDPLAALGLTGNQELTQQAQRVRDLLQQVAAKL